MNISSFAMSFRYSASFHQQIRLGDGAPRAGSDPVSTSSEPAHVEETPAAAVLERRSSYQLAIELRVRAQVSGQGGAPGREETGNVERDELTPRQRGRQLKRMMREELKDLGRGVRKALRPLMRRGSGLSRDDRAEIRELARDFRHDLKDAFRDSGRGRNFDPQKLIERVHEAFGNLIQGLEDFVAARTPREPEHVMLPTVETDEHALPSPQPEHVLLPTVETDEHELPVRQPAPDSQASTSRTRSGRSAAHRAFGI